MRGTAEIVTEDLNWMFLAKELDNRTRTNAGLVSAILTDKNISTVVDSITPLASIAKPVASAVTELTTFAAKALTEVFKNNRDDQAGLFLASFIEKEHYPFGKRDKEDVPDLTANMFLNYTIFAY